MGSERKEGSADLLSHRSVENGGVLAEAGEDRAQALFGEGRGHREDFLAALPILVDVLELGGALRSRAPTARR
jgi:hypothetical protein